MSPQPVPAQDVIHLVNSIMDSRRYRGFQINKVDFAFFPSAYTLVLLWNGKTVEVKIPSELIHDILSGKDNFQKRKVKRMIKEVLGIKHDE